MTVNKDAAITTIVIACFNQSLPANISPASGSRTKTFSITPTSVQACRFLVLFLKIAVK